MILQKGDRIVKIINRYCTASKMGIIAESEIINAVVKSCGSEVDVIYKRDQQLQDSRKNEQSIKCKIACFSSGNVKIFFNEAQSLVLSW